MGIRVHGERKIGLTAMLTALLGSASRGAAIDVEEGEVEKGDADPAKNMGCKGLSPE
jgi:hypothetical protein